MSLVYYSLMTSTSLNPLFATWRSPFFSVKYWLTAAARTEAMSALFGEGSSVEHGKQLLSDRG
jgi:hypothetical protein